jgi:hypothetical protein
MDPALWNAWTELPGYVAGEYVETPFEHANAVSIDNYYKNSDASDRNRVAKFISSSEIPALLESVDWQSYRGKKVVDIGGGYGSVMEAVKMSFPDVDCVCLDLPYVIEEAPYVPDGVTLVAGNMFQPSTIPPCHVIFSKHVLCDWDDDDVSRALQSFYSVLFPGGKVIIADAVLVDGQDANNRKQLMVAMDVLLLLVGGKMERSTSQWQKLATEQGFCIDSIAETISPSVHVITMSKC